MPEYPITESERLIMEAVWASSPRTSAEIVTAVMQNEDWSPKTVHTLIGRLVKKGMLRREGEGRSYQYEACISRDEYVRSKSRGLVETLFRGRVAPLVAAFAEDEAISREDLDELRAVLDEFEKRGGGQ
ncbi:BlaI/MecI/CopY family transcriptional regulator [Wenzhouxiangella marina]|uniref:CopY family transcriptional repressor n=1 Tax=Wenzhouxiangella marina TaxID=1579979 RepID=A0A0K0XV05_9GAMM|nr:BlaI/MecI/CopY family transcriptional regulator [Wenzhouxiangella marina]AKS41513.1 CopY family transcriptional repressor [Wenzhouxiangella marina]MBB6086728.1 putative transcriptional regulator [Wenzhouxiangella marina]